MAEGPMLGRTVRFQSVLPNGEQASFSGMVSMEVESGSQVGVQIYGYPDLCWLPSSQVEIVEPEASARDLIRDLRALIHLQARHAPRVGDEDRLEALGVRFEGGEPLEDQAGSLMDEIGICVGRTATFEVTVGTGDLDRRLCFECVAIDSRVIERGENVLVSVGYEIRHVHYRCSGDGREEVELRGEDQEVAETLGRRVVPELHK